MASTAVAVPPPTKQDKKKAKKEKKLIKASEPKDERPKKPGTLRKLYNTLKKPSKKDNKESTTSFVASEEPEAADPSPSSSPAVAASEPAHASPAHASPAHASPAHASEEPHEPAPVLQSPASSPAAHDSAASSLAASVLLSSSSAPALSVSARSLQSSYAEEEDHHVLRVPKNQIQVHFGGAIGNEFVDRAQEKPSDSFLDKLKKFIYDTKQQGSLVYFFFNKEGQDVLPQFWPMRDFDDTERGPIPLNEEFVKEEGAFRNWSGNQEYVPAKMYKPRNLKEAKKDLKDAYDNGWSVTVVGGAYGHSNLVSTRGALMNTKHLTSILKYNLDEHAQDGVESVTVQSGIPIIDVVQGLASRKRVLPTSPIFAKMSMGGGLAVGIHGTGRECMPLPDYVLDITVININKEGQAVETTYTKKEHPEIMKALNCNIGALGFVYSITVQVDKMFNLKAIDKRVPYPATKKKFAKQLKQWVMENEYVELFWWPTTTTLWVKMWNRTEEEVTPDWKLKLSAVNQYFESYAATGMVDILTAFPKWTPAILDAMQYLVLPDGHSEVVAPANVIYNYLISVPPKHWDLNQCVDIKNHDFSGIAESYMKIKELVDEDAKQGRYTLNTTLHTRFISKSEAYLSPVNGNEISAMTEVLSWNKTSDWVSFFKKVEDMWLGMGGRPHWGKLIFQLPPKSVWGKDGHGMHEFLKIKDKLDPHYVFFNDYHYDIFMRLTPKMVTIRINDFTVHETWFTRVKHIYSHLFQTEDIGFTFRIVSASDERVSAAVCGAADTKIVIDQTFRNITYSNFIVLQLWVKDEMISTAIWHAPLYDYSEGETVDHDIYLQPNWFTEQKRGTLNISVTPINYGFHAKETFRNKSENVGIIGTSASDDDDDRLMKFVYDSARAGYRVYVNAEPTDECKARLNVKPEDERKLKVSVTKDVNEIVSSCPIVVFACSPSEAQEFVKQSESLVDKVVVDATRYFPSGADDADSVDFGEDVTVAAIEEDTDRGVTGVKINAPDSGTEQAVAAWVKHMKLITITE